MKNKTKIDQSFLTRLLECILQFLLHNELVVTAFCTGPFRMKGVMSMRNLQTWSRLLKITYSKFTTGAWTHLTLKSCFNQKAPLYPFSFPLLIPTNTVLYYTTPDLAPDDVIRSKHTMTLLKKEGHKSHLYYKWELFLLKMQIQRLNDLKCFLHKQVP